MRAMTQAMGGHFVPFPLWEGLTERKLVTIFPLGGCPMGPTSTESVVDSTGRVFNTLRGQHLPRALCHGCLDHRRTAGGTAHADHRCAGP
jgi:hypothetical protein